MRNRLRLPLAAALLSSLALAVPANAALITPSTSSALPVGHDGRTTVLVLGSDGRTPVETDLVTVLSVNPTTGNVTRIAIPSDISGFPRRAGTFKGEIADLYASYAGGAPASAAAIGKVKADVAYALDIEIDGYVFLGPDVLPQLVDAVLGVRVYLDPKLYPFGIWDASRTARFQPGWVTLNGHDTCTSLAQKCHDVMAYVESSKGPRNSDARRAERAQDVLEAIFAKVGSSPKALLATMVLIGTGRIVTDLPMNVDAAVKVAKLVRGGAVARTLIIAAPRWATETEGGATRLDVKAVRTLLDRWFAPVPGYHPVPRATTRWIAS